MYTIEELEAFKELEDNPFEDDMFGIDLIDMCIRLLKEKQELIEGLKEANMQGYPRPEDNL